ncbi:MAG: hypothetical protein WCK98_07400 [bacterium]
MSIAISSGSSWDDLNQNINQSKSFTYSVDRGVGLLFESTKAGLEGLEKLSQHVAYTRMSSVIGDLISQLNIEDEQVQSSILLLGHKDSFSSNRPLNILSDILNSKRLLIYILENKLVDLTSSIQITKKEQQVLGTSLSETSLNLENLLRIVLAAIFNIENMLLFFMSEVIVDFNDVDINGEFVLEYQVYADAIQIVKNSKQHFEAEFLSISQLVESYMEDKLNFHLISSTNIGSVNGDVVFQGLKVNHALQNQVLKEGGGQNNNL